MASLFSKAFIRKDPHTKLVQRRRFSRRRITLHKVTHSKIAPPRVVTKRAPYNKYLEAINQVEKGLLDAAAMRQSRRIAQRHAARLKSAVVEATQNREYVYARKMLGHTIYATLLGSRTPRRGKRQTSSPSASSVIKDLKNAIGKDRFSRLMGLDGGVTLAFAVDTTGSMGDEIQGVKQIATDIINHPRNMDVDYILSPFNDPDTDPGHGPVSYRSSSEKTDFLSLISRLTANRGGDCPELTIAGIQNIYSNSPQAGSPIYVFTDAGPKDASKDNTEILIESAEDMETPINFFLSRTGCLTSKDYKVFGDISEKTGGQLLTFHSSQLKGMSQYVNKALTGSTSLPVKPGSVSGKRSSLARYPILVDDSIKTLSISVVKQNAPSSVALKQPSGTLQVSGKTNIRKGVIYLIDNPPTGMWHLEVTQSTGNDYVKVWAVSEENIDFNYFFMVKVKRGRRSIKTVVSRNPLKGQTANVVVTLAGNKHISPSSLRLLLVNKNLRPIKNLRLTSYGSAAGRYKGTFTPPLTEFKLVLSGLTRSGNPFERVRHEVLKSSAALARIHYAPRGFTLKPGHSSRTRIYFAVHNFGPSERFNIKIIDKQNYVQRLVSARAFIRKGGMALIPVKYKARSSARRGSIHKSVFEAKGVTSKTRVSVLLDLLVV